MNPPLERQERSSRLWAGVALAALALPASVAAWSLLPSSEDTSAALGVRLGMTLSQVRDRFEHPGGWSTAVGDDGLVLLHWSPEGPSELREVSFEFHEGLLVALRGKVSGAFRDPSLNGSDPLTVDVAVVRQVTENQDGSRDLLLIARSCPSHRAEVATLLEASE